MYSVNNTLFIGRSILHLQQVNSTNTRLKEMVAAMGNAIPEGQIVIADEQTAGRGRNTNTWQAEAGKNITASILLRPHFLDPIRIFYLNKAIALAVHDTVEELLHDKVRIKWPNDIYAVGKKIAGLLIENGLNSSSIQFVIAGIGLNVNQEDFDDQLANATSLCCLAHKKFEMNQVLEILSAQLEKYYLQLRTGEFNAIDGAYHRHLLWKDEMKNMIVGDRKISGIIRSVDETGNLMVEADGVLNKFSAVVFI